MMVLEEKVAEEEEEVAVEEKDLRKDMLQQRPC